MTVSPQPEPDRHMLRTLARRLWRILPEARRWRYWALYQQWLTRRYIRAVRHTPKLVAPPPGSPIVVAGLFRAANGLGEAARSTYRALTAVGLSPIAVDFTEAITIVDLDTDIPLSKLPLNGVGTLILHINPPEMVLALKYLQLPDAGQWRIIGYWAWELPIFPAGWEVGFDLVAEVWTLSEFSARALMNHPRACSVRCAPIAVSVPDGIREDRARFGIRESVFTVLTMADARSSFGRKNPLGAITAFRSAFGDRSDCELIVKTRNLELFPAAKHAIDDTIGTARNIRLIDESLSEHDRWSLLASVDVVISLHRAEGFALVPAEAMALGKVVIATGWSGNMSYMSPHTAELVDYRLTLVADDFGIYGKQGDPGVWAEPSLDIAVKCLRRLLESPSYRHELGLAAHEKISQDLNPIAVGRLLQALLGNSHSSNAIGVSQERGMQVN